jgi:hypothetical protein
MFTESLPSSERLLGLRYSGFERRVTVLSQHLLDGLSKTTEKIIRQEIRFAGRDWHLAHAFLRTCNYYTERSKNKFQNNFLKPMSSKL